MLKKFFWFFNIRNKKFRSAAVIIAAVVVFSTTYSLILPALTIDNETASHEPGLSLADTSSGDQPGAAASENTSAGGAASESTELSGDQTEGGPASSGDAESGDSSSSEGTASGESGSSEGAESGGSASQGSTAGEEPASSGNEASSGSGQKPSSGGEAAPVSSSDEKTGKNGKDAADRHDQQVVIPEDPAEGINGQAGGTGTETVPALTDPAANAAPAVVLTADTAGQQTIRPEHVITVTVEAEEGTFPEGTTLNVSEVTGASYIDRAVKRVVAESPEIEGVVSGVNAVDISFYDQNNKETKPLKPVKVTLSSDIIESAEDPVLVSVPIPGNYEEMGKSAEIVPQEDKIAEPEKKDDEIIFKSEAVNVYAIVETSIEENVLASDGHNYKVTATYGPETGIPQDADLTVEEITADTSAYDGYVAGTENALGMEEGSAGYIRLFDIKIVDKDDPEIKYQPSEGTAVDVRIELSDSKSDALNVVHFADDEEEGNVVEGVESDGKSVNFAADGFSVYAVVGDGSTEDEARATVNFYGKDKTTPVATVYVKNSDTAAELEDIVFDPGCGQLDSSKKELFDGWIISTVNTTDGSTYTVETEGKTIEEVRASLAELEIHEGDEVNIYAKIVRTITISYQGEDSSTILGVNTVKVLGSDDPDSPDSMTDYTINMNYTPETSTQAFMGWNVASGASNIVSAEYGGESAEPPYQNGTKIRVKGDVALSVNAPTGHWLVFDENGKGATYNAPAFIQDGETTSEPPLEMTRLGYTFGGWYTDPECTDGNEFTFGGELTDNTTIYAKWTSTQTANYTVIVWKESMSDTYDENGGTGEGKEKHYDFAESFTLTGNVGSTANAVSNGTSSVVDGDDAGTRYYNARVRGTAAGGGNVDRTIAYTGYHCADYDTNVTITPEGNTVINVYYDRNTVKYTFYTYGESSSTGTWWLCNENGGHLLRDGARATSSDRIATRNGNNYSQYTGTVRHDDGTTYYYQTGGGTCDPTRTREAHWEYVENTSSQWNIYQESTGLYGEKLDWPTDTGIFWYEDHTGSSGTGTRMTYKDAFLPLDSDMTVEYWGNTASAAGTIHFWTQDIDGGNSYTDQVQVSAGTANFNINDKFTGFYAYQYRADNGNWVNVGALNPETGIYGEGVNYRNRLDIRYNRAKANINFLDGSYFDGNGNRMDETPQAEAFNSTEDYFYESDVSSYNKGGSDYYTPPEKTGYTFAGWYADDACTLPYDFTTMPLTGITVYAKWVQNQYRVFLHPNVPESDTTLHWGSDDQDMNFRVSSGGKVSTPTGTRTGYHLIGWYLDEACTQVFDGDKYVLNDTTVTTPYDKTRDMTDVMNKYGNIIGEGYNSDLTGDNGKDRFWITRKLDLYAKWRAEIVGAEGIGVKYDANGGSNAPNDTNLYLDNSDTVAQGASTPPDDTQQFLYWVLQRWDETAQKYVDIPGDHNKIYPGQEFTVLMSDSRIEELDGSTEDDPKYRYTIQLRAQYGPKDEPTPTHLTWYGNGGSADDGTTIYTDPNLQINEAVPIHPSSTFKRPGYEFIGWARVDSTTEGYEIEEKDLTEDDLFLKYEDGQFYAQITDGSDEWSPVTKVAADERLPYHDLYAVWEKKTYTVTVTKAVFGLDSDQMLPFTFTPDFTGLTGEDYTTPFRLVGNENGADIEEDSSTVHIEHIKTFTKVPYDTEFSITETVDPEFDVSESYAITNADDPAENQSASGIANGAPITVKGDVEVVVTNTRKNQNIRVLKTEIDEVTPLAGAVFKVVVEDVEYTLTSDEDGYLKNDLFEDGIMPIPFGTYELAEMTPPVGYLPLKTDISVRVDGEGVHVNGYTVNDPTEDENYYTIIVPNNSGVELPMTGGSGVNRIYMAGLCLVAAAVMALFARRKRSR